MHQRIIFLVFFVFVSIGFLGCPAAPPKEKSEVPKKSRVRLKVKKVRKVKKRTPKRSVAKKRGCPLSKDKAFCKRWKQCKQGKSSVCFSIARQFFRGEKVKQSDAEALVYFALACKGGYGLGCLHAGMLFENGKIKSPKQKEWSAFYFRKACDLKLARGCTQIAFFYELGIGARKRSTKWSLYFFKKACEYKNANACGHVGMFYAGFRTSEVKKDYNQAVKYLKMSCDQSDGQGCKNLGSVLSMGKGKKKNMEEAQRLWEKACRLQDAPGCDIMAQIFIEKKSWEKAHRTLKKSCSLLSSSGCYEWGQLFAKGLGVSRDPKRANQLFRKSCTLHHADGCYAFGMLYKGGDGPGRDSKKFVSLMRKSCNMRGGRGCYELALLTQKGLFGVKKDSQKAKSLLRQSCSIGYKPACKATK